MPGSVCDDHVGVVRGTAADVDGAVVDGEAEHVGHESHLGDDADAPGGVGVEGVLEGEHGGVAPDGHVVGERRRSGTPALQAHEDRLEPGSPLGELVDVRRGGRREPAAPDDAGVLELPQPLGEDVRAGLGQAGVQVGEALGAEEQVADDEQRPALPDEVEGVSGRAPVAVAAHRDHASQATADFS